MSTQPLVSTESTHPIVSREEWLATRRELLAKEKKLTRQLEVLHAERRRLPWVKVEKEYLFDGPDGRATLADLFEGRSQLIIYHFMFAPDWKEGCRGCSFLADHFDGPNLHLAHHDVSLVVVSRAPRAQFEGFRKRMGWQFKWVSSCGSDFNSDYQATITAESIAAGEAMYNFEPIDEEGDLPGVSVFVRNAAGDVFHTYSTYARGCDVLIGTHQFLDLTPKGRNEKGTMDWVRLHDQYEGEHKGNGCGCGAKEGSAA